MNKKVFENLQDLIEFLSITGQYNLIVDLIFVLITVLIAGVIISCRLIFKYGPTKEIKALTLQVKSLEGKLNIDKTYKVSILDNISFKKALNDLHSNKGLRIKNSDVQWRNSASIELKSLPDEIQKLLELGFVSSYTDNGEFVTFNPLFNNEEQAFNFINELER